MKGRLLERVVRVCLPSGAIFFQRLETRENIALKLPSGIVLDLREQPLYLVMTPCPACGAVNDKDHTPLYHTSPYWRSHT